MKKIICVMVLTFLLCNIVTTAYAAAFTDFDRMHWAYEYVNTLVEKKTINGFSDGTFRPEATVTRAEFVKMIGFGHERRTDEFDDVNPSHWAYEYIMTSGLDALRKNDFCPDVAITRGDVANLLWKRAGSVRGVSVPPVVHCQGSNRDAVSWVYSNGIMTGDDNINLRLGDTLTRAEAAALIVRSGNVASSDVKTDFLNAIDPKLFKIAYDSFGFVDKPYDENAKLTNGELAMAAARIICDESKPSYKNISATKSFEHKYALPLNMLCRYYLGEENDNAEYADKTATVKDAVAALMFAVTRSANSPVLAGDANANYPLAQNESNEKLKKLLSVAFNNGICLSTPDAMPLEREITLKEFACLLIEFDGFSGIYTADCIGISSYYKDYSLRTSLESYPENASDYRIILENVPNRVYEAPFVSAVSKPSETHSFTQDYKQIFESALVSWVAKCYNFGVTLRITYFPGLCVDNGNGYTMRVLLEFTDVPEGKRLSDLISVSEAITENKVITAGDRFYADIETGNKINDVYIRADKLNLVQIID